MAEVTVVEALETFSVNLKDGSPFNVSKGDRFLASDPVVKGRERLFGELTVRSSGDSPSRSAQATETATAAPGERRAPTKPSSRKEGSDA